MGKLLFEVEYKGGHPKIPIPGILYIEVDSFDKCIRFKRLVGRIKCDIALIDNDQIINISLDEKSKRSVGKAAAGAIVGGILTGGIGLVAGGLIGGRKKDISNVYITIAPNGREVDIVLKAGKQAEKLYAAIASIL